MRMASLPLLLERIGLTAEEWSERMNSASVPLMMLLSQGEVYMEVEAVDRILAGSSSGQSWSNFIARHGLRRKLTKTEKIKVAASQKWLCMRCRTLLDECFEVDHVEMHSLRGNDSRSNMQALCPSCHRKKTYDDIYRASPHFGVEALQNLQQDERNRKHKSNEREQAPAAEVGVRHCPPEAVPFSRFRRPAALLHREPNDAGVVGGGGQGALKAAPHPRQ